MATQAGPAGPRDTLLIRGGRVYDPQGDVDDPPVRDICIENGIIVSVTGPHDRGSTAAGPPVNGAEVLDASGKLVMPGFVNAHYHSYDTLAKGMFEDMPFDIDRAGHDGEHPPRS